MSVGQRAKYMGDSDHPPVSGPAEDGWWKHRDSSGPHEAKTMVLEEFMDKYADAVLAQYHLPTKAELAAIERWAADDDSESTDGETIDTSEVTQGNFRREQFRAISSQADFANQMAIQTGSGSGAEPSASGSGAGPSASAASGST
jgi:hypothetical protein